jgi:U4/U6.U5 tri-snRNP-associated protein 3
VQRSDVEGVEDDMEVIDPDAEAMAAMFGFAGFGSTKDKKVQEDFTAAEIKKPRTHRQYMNRPGGFNR